MSRKNGDRRPYLKPVTKIELSENNIRLRKILVVVLIVIAAVSIGIGISTVVNTQPGWNAIDVASKAPNCSVDFTLMYNFSDLGGNASAVNKQLITLYTTATENAYRIFSPEVVEEGFGNVGFLNAHINETVTVDETLYQALSLVESYGNRCIYLAPVYMEYDRVFRSESDPEAAGFDPTRNPQIMEFVSCAAAFANDPQKVDVQLLENNQVCLTVSEDYLAFARENGIEAFLDFAWMKNAFIADYIAQLLADSGYTAGYLASYDGFTRNLDASGEVFTTQYFDRQGLDIYAPAQISYQGPMSFVLLRNYPLGQQDRWQYYAYQDGGITTTKISPETGKCASATDNLMAHSEDAGCARLLLEILPLYLTDTLNEDALLRLSGSGIHSIWSDGEQIRYTNPALSIHILEGESYTLSQVK